MMPLTHDVEGELIWVRPLRAEDWPALFSAASDPDIWRQHPASDRYTESVFRAFFDDALSGGMALVIIDRATNEVIGSSRYSLEGVEDGAIEIGWTFLARRYWGGRYNRELKTLMLEAAFREYQKVIFFVGSDNLRSRRALEKIGARATEQVVDRGGVDHLVYEINRCDDPGS